MRVAGAQLWIRRAFFPLNIFIFDLFNGFVPILLPVILRSYNGRTYKSRLLASIVRLTGYHIDTLHRSRKRRLQSCLGTRNFGVASRTLAGGHMAMRTMKCWWKLSRQQTAPRRRQLSWRGPKTMSKARLNVFRNKNWNQRSNRTTRIFRAEVYRPTKPLYMLNTYNMNFCDEI